jgi:antagonist of KipI
LSLIIQKQGVLTTVQDGGRYGYRRYGIGVGGSMDRSATRLINILLGNKDSEAVVEMHYPAPVVEFEESIMFALGGANFGAELDESPIDNWRVHRAEAGSVLRFRDKKKGNRAYLAIRGGIEADEWLGSKSTHLVAMLGGRNGREVSVNDRLSSGRLTRRGTAPSRARVSRSLIPVYSSFPTVRVFPGPEFHLLTAKSEQAFFSETYSVTVNSDRMGFRLLGEPLHLLERREMLSSAVTFGTVQLLPDSQLAILMADHQTTGGYPRIGQIAAIDLPLVAQLGPGDKIGFHMISVEEAEALSLQFENDLRLLRLGCRLMAEGD